MTFKHIAATTAIVAVSLSALTGPVRAAEQTTIELAGHQVPVTKGGLYERFRSNSPLSVVAEEAPDVDLSWFKQLKKTKVDIGFETYSPNFYYKSSRITAVFTADLDRLKALMPPEILQKVQPLQIWPGRGVVALTSYTYRYCDNDQYNEFGLSIVTTQPGATSWGPLTLLGQSRSKEFWGYVLKLPVDSELGRVRGVVGYNLPKRLTRIDFREDSKAMRFEIFDSATGKPDVTMVGQKLDDVSNEVTLSNSHFTTVRPAGGLQSGYSTSRDLRHASSTRAEDLTLALTDGPLSSYIKALKLGKMLRYDYVPDFQAALYAPELLK